MIGDLQNGQQIHSPIEFDKSYTVHQELKDFVEVEIDEITKLKK